MQYIGVVYTITLYLGYSCAVYLYLIVLYERHEPGASFEPWCLRQCFMTEPLTHFTLLIIYKPTIEDGIYEHQIYIKFRLVYKFIIFD